MTTEKITLNSCFDNWMLSGIFDKFKDITSIPWGSDSSLSSRLDMVYHGNHSGDKIISPLVSKLLDDNNKLSDADITLLANSIYSIYGKNWQRLWDINIVEYNPITNYDMTEEESVQHSSTNTGTVTNNTTGTNTGTITTDLDNTSTGTVSTSTSDSASRNNNTYGFNSSDEVPASSEEDTSTASSTVTNNLADTSDSTVTNNLASSENSTMTNNLASSDNESRTLTRSGNIGVTTTQQMIQSSIELAKWDYFNAIFKDIDKILTLSVY